MGNVVLSGGIGCNARSFGDSSRRPGAAAGSRRDQRPLQLGEACPDQQQLGAVVPDVHAYDLATADDESIDVAVAGERLAVGPFAVQRPRVVDGRFLIGGARNDVGTFELLLDAAVARGVEGGRAAGTVESPAAGEGDP